MMRAACVLAVVVASSAWAGKKTVILAGGDCVDAGLIAGAKDFRDAAARELGASLMEGETVLDIVRPRPTRSVSDIERQVDSARTLFYGGQVDRAEQLVDRALEELERASPEAKPWPVTQAALVLKALIAKNAERTKDMAEAFRRIVRVEPSFKLDPDAHPPSAIAALDAVKKELARTRKTTVTIRIDPPGPVGAVFLDGMPAGAAPLKIDLVPGSYRVAIVSSGMVSFPHRLEVPKDSKLGIDFAFEGSVGTQPPLCILGAADAPAIKLAQLVAAEQVIVLRNGSRRGEPVYLSGTLYDLATGKQERAGSVQPGLVPALATFLVTGRKVKGVDDDVDSPPVAKVEPVKVEVAKSEPQKETPKVETPKVETPKPVVKTDAPKVDEPGRGLTSPPPPPPKPAAIPGAEPSSGRVASFALLAGGGVSVLAGALIWIAQSFDGAARYRVDGLTYDQGRTSLPLITQPAARESLLKEMPILDTFDSLSLVLIGGGVGMITAGLVGLQLFPDAPTRLSVSATPGGGGLHVTGRF